MKTQLGSQLRLLTPLQSLLYRRWRPQWVCQNCQQLQRRRAFASSKSRTTSANAVKPYYLTTPIFYVNAAPHVGHMYTMILADVLKRWQQLKGRHALLCTGTDEHGLKIQQAAARENIDPKEFCDTGAEVFKDLAESIDVSADTFIRTTDPRHKEAVEYAWQMLQEKGLIYESKHEGWYSISDETYYPQGQVQLIVEPPTGRKIMVSIETGKEVEWTSERNYHFRLSAFRDRLLEFYKQNPEFIVPPHRMQEVVQEVTAGLEDLSVSRPVDRLTWGVRVPNDPSQTIYVWIDALLSYATAAGYPFTPGSERSQGWPADVHVVGKDIIRFHCIYWPAILMALGLELPKQVLTHAHWTLGRQKMAKSTGNVVNPFFALERFGVDVMRWYLISNGGIINDGDYDNRFIIEKYKKHLKGGLGNLTSRVIRGSTWDIPATVARFANPDGDGPQRLLSDGAELALNQWCGAVRALPSRVEQEMQSLMPNRALRALTEIVAINNGHLSKFEPWKIAARLKKLRAAAVSEESSSGKISDETAAEMAELELGMQRVLYLSAETLRLTSIMLQPFIPQSAHKLLDIIGVRPDRRSWEWCRMGCDDAYGTPMEHVSAPEQQNVFLPLSSDS